MKEIIVCMNDNDYSAYVQGKYEAELIRCKDCKHSVDYYNDGSCYCRSENYNGESLIYVSGGWNHYCGYAERKVEDGK